MQRATFAQVQTFWEARTTNKRLQQQHQQQQQQQHHQLINNTLHHTEPFAKQYYAASIKPYLRTRYINRKTNSTRSNKNELTNRSTTTIKSQVMSLTKPNSNPHVKHLTFKEEQQRLIAVFSKQAQNKQKPKQQIADNVTLQHKTWSIKNATDQLIELPNNLLHCNQSVDIRNCANCTINIPRTICHLVIINSENCSITFRNCVASSEISYSKNIDLYCTHYCGTIQVDITKDISIYLDKEKIHRDSIVAANVQDLKIFSTQYKYIPTTTTTSTNATNNNISSSTNNTNNTSNNNKSSSTSRPSSSSSSSSSTSSASTSNSNINNNNGNIEIVKQFPVSKLIVKQTAFRIKDDTIYGATADTIKSGKYLLLSNVIPTDVDYYLL